MGYVLIMMSLIDSIMEFIMWTRIGIADDVEPAYKVRCFIGAQMKVIACCALLYMLWR